MSPGKRVEMIFLTSLPEGEGKWQVSNGGGWTLFHSRGEALFYRAADGSFMSVPVDGSSRRSSLSIVQHWQLQFASK